MYYIIYLAKYIATASLDQTVRLYNKESIINSQKAYRINCEYDYPSAMCFSEDSRFLIFITDSLREVFFYLVPQSDNEKPVLYKSFKLNIIGSIRRLFSSGTNDNLVLYTACLENDNIIKVYDSTGKKITQEDIKQNVIYDIECSNNGQFISPASFCSGVKVYECGRTREGMYKKFNQIMTLNGHKSGVTAVGFGDKRTRMITVSKDKTWKIWGISVRYNEGGEPHLLYSYPTELNVQFALLSETYNVYLYLII